MPFLNPYDIGNRALQHVGAAFINTFADNSKNAVQIAFAYDKVRRAELRRAVWRFATRRAVLRALDGNSQLFSPPAWAIGTTYGLLQCVTYLGVVWQSQFPGNLGNTPGVTNLTWAVYVGPSIVEPWSSATTYYNGDLVSSGGTTYSALISNFSGVAPPNASYWVSQGVAAIVLVLPGPVGYGPHSTDAVLSIYRLPYGYLRLAPQDRKAADVEVLGVSAGLRYSDWAIEDQYLVTADTGPLFIRFVGDISLVPLMDDMFAEGFAARLGMEVCEPLTQSKEKFQIISAHYDRFMREARAVNAIEIASTEDGMDEDRLAARAAPAAANG